MVSTNANKKWTLKDLYDWLGTDAPSEKEISRGCVIYNIPTSTSTATMKNSLRAKLEELMVQGGENAIAGWQPSGLPPRLYFTAPPEEPKPEEWVVNRTASPTASSATAEVPKTGYAVKTAPPTTVLEGRRTRRSVFFPMGNGWYQERYEDIPSNDNNPNHDIKVETRTTRPGEFSDERVLIWPSERPTNVLRTSGPQSVVIPAHMGEEKQSTASATSSAGSASTGNPRNRWFTGCGSALLIAAILFGCILLWTLSPIGPLRGIGAQIGLWPAQHGDWNPLSSSVYNASSNRWEGINSTLANEPQQEPETPTKAPDATVAPTMAAVVAQPTVGLTSQGSLPPLPVSITRGKWTINENSDVANGVTDPIVRDWLARLEDPMPDQWKYFPNVANPDRPDLPTSAEKPAPWGAEYGMAESPYCETHPCDIPISAQHYRYISGDYSFLGNTCRGNEDMGCLLLLYNVGKDTVIWRNQDVDNGFTVHGRYHDGDILEIATLGLVSHGSANMLGMKTFANKNGEVLNAGSGTNAGTNCSNPEGCKSVNVLVVISAGDRILATAKTMVTKP